MRTTLDISDDLYRQAKSQAALRGVPFRDLIEEGLRQLLGAPAVTGPVATGPAATGPAATGAPRRVPFPLHRSRQPGALCAEAVRQAEEQTRLDEDAQHAGIM